MGRVCNIMCLFMRVLGDFLVALCIGEGGGGRRGCAVCNVILMCVHACLEGFVVAIPLTQTPCKHS